MNAFNELRKLAADKRDKAIHRAKAEYDIALTRISELDQMIQGKFSPGRIPVSKAIDMTLPDDRPFTTHDVMAGLKALDPKRDWRQRSIDNYMSQLRKRGDVKRLRRNGINRHALYAKPNVVVPNMPFTDMLLVDVIETVLKRANKPLTQTEIVVLMLEMGYETEQTPKYLRNHVGTTMRKHVRFKVNRAKRWCVAND